jgi:hypothetical protein
MKEFQCKKEPKLDSSFSLAIVCKIETIVYLPVFDLTRPSRDALCEVSG